MNLYPTFSSPNPSIAINNVIFDNINLLLLPGEMALLLTPSAISSSTLLHALSRLIEGYCSSSLSSLEDYDITANVTMGGQQPLLYSRGSAPLLTAPVGSALSHLYLTIRENLELALFLDDDKLRGLLSHAGLSPIANQFINDVAAKTRRRTKSNQFSWEFTQ